MHLVPPAFIDFSTIKQKVKIFRDIFYIRIYLRLQKLETCYSAD